MPFTFTAIDFETANAARASACSIGYTVVRDGEILRTEHSLIFPPTGLVFSNTFIHGISPSDVENAPQFAVVMAEMLEANPDAPLVAYSPFDKGVWNAAWAESSLTAPEVIFRDALAAAKAHLTLDGYGLPVVAEHLGLPAFDHHNAAADALACAQVVLGIRERAALNSFADLWPAHTTGRPEWRKSILPAASTDADPLHPLFGAVLCFTGDLESMTRDRAHEASAECGAVVGPNVTKKTTLVIQGDYRPGVLTQKLSSKTRRALELMDKGQDIRVISEEEFLTLLGPTTY